MTERPNLVKRVAGALFLVFVLAFIPILLVAGLVGQLSEGGILRGAHGAVAGRSRSEGSGRNSADSYRLAVLTDDGVVDVAVTSGAYLGCPDGARLDIAPVALWFDCGGETYTHPALFCPCVGFAMLLTWLALVISWARERLRARSAG